jgi:hypothetical protein
MTANELMRYFDFDESDLNANRNGNLSSNQNERLSRKDKSSRKAFLIIGVVLALLTSLSIIILWLVDRLAFVGWYSLIWVIPCGFLAFLFIRAGLRYTAFILKKAEGEIEITKGGSYNDPAGIYYELKVGGKVFGISESLADRMKKENGKAYVVYYYWGSDTVETDLMDSYIVSIEKISPK